MANAFKDPNFYDLPRFFACGYQLAFVSAHFPALVTEMCSSISPSSLLHYIGISTTSSLGALAIAIIGFSNIFGTIYAGWLGQRFPKKYLLAIVYTLRNFDRPYIYYITNYVYFCCFIFIFYGIIVASHTVPLTSGLIAHIYGLRYMGTPYGLVFLSHQLGSFLGVWMGGKSL